MLRYQFNFKGGVTKYPPERVTSKFLLFHFAPKEGGLKQIEEHILFKALQSGNVIHKTGIPELINPSNSLKEHMGQSQTYETNYPWLKVFTLVEGFGVQRQFFSFYFKLDIHEAEVKILPVCGADNSGYFSGRGKLMSGREVTELIGADSPAHTYYTQQMPLPESVLRRIIVKDAVIAASPATSKIRKIRF